MSAVPPTTPPALLVGPICARSALPPAARFAITFGVLFALKAALPHMRLGPAVQVLVLLVVATACLWRFWWRCTPDRRAPLLLVGTLWVAGALKRLVQARAH